MNVVARKTTTLTVVLALMLALLFGLIAAFGGETAAAQSDPGGAPSEDGVDPVFIAGNPSCSSLGNYRELKVEPVNAGSYPSSDGYLTATISNIRDEGLGQIFEWSSTRGVDRVIVKGGPNADAYVYTPEDTTDDMLHAPVNPSNGKYFGLSHVSFCYDVEPQVSKTATTSFTRTYDWEITKSVTPETWDLFKGDSGESEYTVTVDRTGFTDSNWAVSGKITVTNPMSNEPLAITQILDVVKQGNTTTNATVSNCTINNTPVPIPFVLAPNASAECSYSASLGSGTNGTNEATAKAIGPGIADGVGTANVTFGNPTNEVNETVTVKDDFEGTTTTLGTATASKTFDPYTRTFTCDADEGEHNNTATVYGENDAVLDSASAKVTVDCHALDVAKDASTSFKRTYNWTIDKAVTPETWDLFKGDTGKSGYTVSVDKTGFTDSDWKVEGTITVTNSAPINATLTGVSDVVSPNIAGNVECEDASGPVAFPYVLAKDGGTLSCTYEALLPDDSDRTNTATATIQNYDYDSEGGKTAAGTTDFSGTAQVSFANAQIDEVNKSITVDDTYAGSGSPWTFNDDGSQSYDRTFACDADEGTHNNTATIRETGQSDNASVTVNCHDLNVTKDANTSFERKWDWTVDKKIDDNGQLKEQLDLTLSIGQAYNASYKVTYNAASTDSKWKVAGTITVTNPAPIPAEVTNVTDLVSPNISANITECNSDTTPDFPYTLAANGGTLTCSYSADLPDATSRTNTATAVLQNYNYNYDLQGGSQKSGTTNFNSSAVPVNFSQATITEIDEQITVSDTYQNSSVTGTVGAASVPKVFTYIRQIGPYSQCGVQDPVVNTASFVTNDTGATGEDTATVNVDVPCAGCTLTIGFWKTHADPTSPRANPDYTLQVLAEQPNGTIWLGTPPVPPATNKSVAVTSQNVVSILTFSGSNGIRKLQAQLLAAKLNIANGADPAAVQNTITAADAFLAKYNAASWNDLTKAKQQQVLTWMSTLDRYNNGLIGPGHCSESPIS